MQSIKLRSRVDADGILRLEVPIELANLELDLVVVYQPVESVTNDTEKQEDIQEIKLSLKDSLAFVESLLNPPEPSSKMRIAAQEYKRSMGL
ncbi:MULTISPECIES: type II toxin -antitoxin system TacA 1-like antitoxin [Calothrix]|uniref:DUF1778 domain-containing protein n=2 Tax=Calothrix TaxID=1186 RepID=A0ABR8AJ34_9CYAN|nr:MULTISPECIES: DUF1778 domain-containing protein [Calothrix]MBD2199283.1 DUF1778 domain-containing protein [Calothrix parietina FACHB-288]MBD2227985.1 DUF1778 domain-containing protein [Calothrix anomala FACHB-343]